MANNGQGNQAQVMQVIQSTPAAQIGDLEFVRKKYVENYNACHKDKNGELMYHRNLVHLKQQIAAMPQLQTAEPFSIYAAFVTAAVNGYSLDPGDNEVYIIARGGKACLDRQAGAYVKRLMRSGQIQYAEQAKLAYQGDDIKVKDGRVIEHVENFKTDIIILGYVKVILDEDGKDLHFIYRKSDWESWRKKSPNPRTYMKTGKNGEYLSESLWDGGVINGTQPDPNFLRTKIVKHAMKEKCWATGTLPVNVETFSEIEIDTDDDGLKITATEYPAINNRPDPNGKANQIKPSPEQIADLADVPDDFIDQQAPPPTVNFDEDDF